MTFQTVGVGGVGQMGSGSVEVWARAGCAVVAREINDELLERGKAYLQRSFARGVERGKITPAEAEAALYYKKPEMALASAKEPVGLRFISKPSCGDGLLKRRPTG
jgi:3-hydroxyacyl-CoA dehydrogenase